eukprot:6213789-Pleurochrysis_carterae.AAC.1
MDAFTMREYDGWDVRNMAYGIWISQIDMLLRNDMAMLEVTLQRHWRTGERQNKACNPNSIAVPPANYP